MRKKKATAAAVLVAAALATTALTQGAVATAGPGSPHHGSHSVGRYTLPAEATTAFPEGIGRFGRHLFVGSATDGTVYRGSVGDPHLRPFLPAGGEGRVQALGIKTDRQGRLYIAGGGTGKVFVHDARSGRHLATFTALGAGNLNDLVVTPGGDVYVTDSARPTLYRIASRQIETAEPGRSATLDPWLPLEGTPVVYEKDAALDVNLNGIVLDPDRRHLITADTNSGALYRISLRDRSVHRVDLAGERVMGDGLVLVGRDLYAVDANTPPGDTIAHIRLSPDATRGRVVARRADPALAFPSTAVADGDDLLVVNLQFDRLATGNPPELPFDVVRVPRT